MSKPSSPRRVAFWDFSKAVYGQPGVKEACLALQDGGLDVNFGLWIVWTVIYGRDPGPAIGAAVDRSALWSADVVKPLRAARTGLKFPPDFVETEAAAALRKTVLGAELEAERLEQLALEGLSQSCPEHRADDLRGLAFARLEAYASKLGATVPATVFIQTIFDALENV
ncbi:TIGR02444 family protein [Maricaulaceae bacterium NA33B04]|nr:TIGR02444 family protein [Maricaulaceae bacterium NA33B04]